MPISAPPPSWASIKNKPNTVAGFGISDMASQTVANATNVTNVTTAQVNAAIAGAAVGGVGSYAFLGAMSASSYVPGATLAGSSLRYSGVLGAFSDWSNQNAVNITNGGSGTAPAGTWRCMGQAGGPANTYGASLWMRIA